MSIALMTQAWKAAMPSGRKMVLLALCDNANDQGECYPSISMLADKCSMGERTVQQHITDMEGKGILARELRNGRSTVYRIDPRKFCTPAESAPPQISHPAPAESAPPPPQNLHPTPADFAPITVKEPSIEPSPNRQKRGKVAKAAEAELDLPGWLPLDAWNAYLEMRKQRRKEPTAYALKLVLADLTKFRDAGHDVEAILGNSIKNGWTDVYAPKAQQQGRPAATPYQTANDKARDWASRLTGKNRNDKPDDPDIIDINPAPAR